MSDAAVFHRSWRREYPVAEKAKGMYIYDVDGNEYLDAVGAVYVVSIGHGVPEVADAMAAQARQLAFAYAGTFTSKPEIELCEAIIEMAPRGMRSVFLVSGGSEANEVAIKIARKYQLAKGRPERWRVVGRWQSYHGATIGAMSASGNTLRRRDYEPYMLRFPKVMAPNCYHCPLGLEPERCARECAEDLERTIRQEGAETIAAFICEPISGASGGGLVPPEGYYERVREICDRHDVLLIADEVITGFGRTGANFAVDHFGLVPDIITCGKGISSGYAPLGAVIVHGKVVSELHDSSFDSIFTGYTFSANPVSCAAGLSVLKYIKEHDLVDRVRKEGDWFMATMREAMAKHPSVGDVRGKGFLIGIEFVRDRPSREPFRPGVRFAGRVVEEAWRLRMLLRSDTGDIDGVSGEHVLLAPPFIASRAELTEIIQRLDEAISRVEAEEPMS
jgi:adenosylmethionine-8-amino-7-oxononanoate aminotransferase